jgi:hypothetical protein
MKRTITFALFAALAFVALLTVSPAVAQVKRPACYPLVNGYPEGAPQIIRAQVGIHIYWFCSDIKGSKPKVEGVSCVWNRCSEWLAGHIITTITRASAKVGTANAFWDEKVEFLCPDVEQEETERGRLCRERRAILDQNAAAWGLK